MNNWPTWSKVLLVVVVVFACMAVCCCLVLAGVVIYSQQVVTNNGISPEIELPLFPTPVTESTEVVFPTQDVGSNQNQSTPEATDQTSEGAWETLRT